MSMLRLLVLIGSSCGVAALGPTCAGYNCIAPHSLRPTPDLISCPLAGCSSASCCELKLPAQVLSPQSQALASPSVSAVTHCTPGTHEYVSDSTANPEVRKAVEQALFTTSAERQNCGIGPLPLFFDSESFLSGDRNTHFVHVQSKFSSNCLSKTFKLNFHIVPGSASVFTIQINRDLGTGLWKFLSSTPAPCHINTNTVSSPQFVAHDSKFVQDAAEFAAAELTFQQRENKCLPEHAKASGGWQVSKVIHAAARVLTGLEITLNLELKAGQTKKTSILTVLDQCGKFEKKCYYQLRLLEKSSVCQPFKAAPTPAVAPSPPLKTGSTCANFKCPATMTLRYQPESLRCDVAGGCTSNLCCLAGAQARRLQDSEDSENIASVLQDDPTEAWEAQRSWLHDNSPEIQSRRLAGSTRSPLARRHIKAGTVPTNYDPTEHDCFKELPVYDQGECGSCYAAAVSQMIGIRLCLLEKNADVPTIGHSSSRRLEQNEDSTEANPHEDSDSDIEVEEDATEVIPGEDSDSDIEVTEEPSPKSLSQESWEANEKRLENIGMKAISPSPTRRLHEATCATFKCPAPTTQRPQAGRLTCFAGGCKKEQCCMNPTKTPPTTTPATCATFKCPAPTTPRPQAGRLTCFAGGCKKEQCCMNPTKTPPTTTPATCGSFVCPAPSTLRLQAGRLVCASGGCTKEHCCMMPTTTPATCATFACPAPMSPRLQSERFVCASGGCTLNLCCLMPTTTPALTTTATTTKEYQVKVGFKFEGDKPVSEDEAKAAIAKSMGVDPSELTVTIDKSRRLEASARLLQKVIATLKTTNKEAAKKANEKMADPGAANKVAAGIPGAKATQTSRQMSAKATCASRSCPQPMQAKTNKASIKCTTDASSGECAVTECCDTPAPPKPTELSETVPAGASTVQLKDVDNLAPGMSLTFTDKAKPEITETRTIEKIVLAGGGRRLGAGGVVLHGKLQHGYGKGAKIAGKAKTCDQFPCPAGYKKLSTTWFLGAGIADCCQEKCTAPTNIPYQATQSCKQGTEIEDGSTCTPQCKLGYMAKLPAYANNKGKDLDCKSGLFVDLSLLAKDHKGGAPPFSCVPETVNLKSGTKAKVVVLRSSMTIWVSMASALTSEQMEKEVKGKTAISGLTKTIKNMVQTSCTNTDPVKTGMPKVEITITNAARQLAGGRRLSDSKFKIEYNVVVAKNDQTTVMTQMKKLAPMFTGVLTGLTVDKTIPEGTVTIEANGYGFHVGEAVVWKGFDNELPQGTVGRVASYDDSSATDPRIIVKFMHAKGKAYSFKTTELVKARQYGLQIGEKVRWRGNDPDVPTGSVGTVLGFKADAVGDNKVTVEFPKGHWNFKAQELKKVFVSTNLRRHALKGKHVLHVQDATFFAVGDTVMVGARTDHAEEGVIVLADTGGLTLKDALKHDHTPSETVKASDFCVDSTIWEHEGALIGEKRKYTGKIDCAFYAKEDPGCTKFKDVGQRTHCQKACHTCPWHGKKIASPETTLTDAWYKYMPSLDQVAQCSKSAGKPSGCNGGGLHNVWNEWMMNIGDTDLWQMGGKCMPYTLKCFASEGVVNPLSTDECELYSGYDLWRKPCSCIPKEVRPKKYTCPSVSPTPDCGVKVPNAMFYVKHMGDGLSNKDAVLNIQRHITEFGPVWLSFEVTTRFIKQNWIEDPVYIGGGNVTGGHSALAVGWGTYVVPYWLLRNSWTKNWAHKGYAKFWRGVNLDKIESSNIGVSMPTADFEDHTAPVCTMHHVETNYKSSGAALDQYMFTPTIRCSEKSSVKLFVSHRLTDRSEMKAGVVGNYYTATVEAKKNYAFSPIEMKGKGFGLKDGYVWIKMTATDAKGNVGEVNNFIEIPKVLARRLLSNETGSSDLFV